MKSLIPERKKLRIIVDLKTEVDTGEAEAIMDNFIMQHKGVKSALIVEGDAFDLRENVRRQLIENSLFTLRTLRATRDEMEELYPGM